MGEGPILDTSYLSRETTAVQDGWNALHNTSVHAHYLTVDPAAIGTHQHRNGIRDVFHLAQSTERVHLLDAIDQGVILALEKQLGRDRAGSDRVDRDLSWTKLFRDDMCHRFDCALC